MKISALLFRFHYLLFASIAVLGFWSPWERMGNPHPGTAWLFLAGALARYRILPIAYSSTVVMGVAILLAILAAMLRTWAATCSGDLRDWQYLGLWLHMLALSILMPPGGALFTLVTTTVAIVFLIRAEKRGSSETSGESRAPGGRERRGWGLAFFEEIYFWGVALTYIAFASRYNVTVLEQGVLVSIGVAVVVQGLFPRLPQR